jgi:Lipid A 3-O-deacylase (PagL)
MHWIKSSSILYFFAMLHLSHAQSQPEPFVEMRLGAGGLVPIYSPFPSAGAVSSLECSIFKKKHIGPSWRMNYGKTHLGWSTQIINLGNSAILGQALSIAPCADHVYRINNRASINARISIGLGYFTKHYDRLDNPENNVIGSSLANVSRFHIEWRKQMTNTWRIGLGMHFIHCSNAHYSVPNVGANILGVHATFAQNKIPPKDHSAVILILLGYTKRINLHLAGGYGLHEFEGTSRPSDGPLYKDPLMTLQLGRVHRTRSTLYTGIQWTQYNSYKHYLLINELVKTEHLQKTIQNYTWFVGYDWFFPHFAFFVQTGIHLYHPSMDLISSLEATKTKSWLYKNTASKLGYRFYFCNMMRSHSVSPYLQMAVKTNGGTAEFFETSLGVLVDW